MPSVPHLRLKRFGLFLSPERVSSRRRTRLVRCRRRVLPALPRRRTGTRPGRAPWSRGVRVVLSCSPQSPAERQRVREALVLLAVEAEKLEPRHLRGVLDLGAVTLEALERARGNGDIAREPERGVPVREFLLAARDGFGPAPPPRGF